MTKIIECLNKEMENLSKKNKEYKEESKETVEVRNTITEI